MQVFEVGGSVSLEQDCDIFVCVDLGLLVVLIIWGWELFIGELVDFFDDVCDSLLVNIGIVLLLFVVDD